MPGYSAEAKVFCSSFASVRARLALFHLAGLLLEMGHMPIGINLYYHSRARTALLREMGSGPGIKTGASRQGCENASDAGDAKDV